MLIGLSGLLGWVRKGWWSGLRESNPSSWLGKPEHYHYAKPAGSGDFSRSEGTRGPRGQGPGPKIQEFVRSLPARRWAQEWLEASLKTRDSRRGSSTKRHRIAGGLGGEIVAVDAVLDPVHRFVHGPTRIAEELTEFRNRPPPKPFRDIRRCARNRIEQLGAIAIVPICAGMLAHQFVDGTSKLDGQCVGDQILQPSVLPRQKLFQEACRNLSAVFAEDSHQGLQILIENRSVSTIAHPSSSRNPGPLDPGTLAPLDPWPLGPLIPSNYPRMSPSTSSRFCSINCGVSASRLSRIIGSVFELRTLKCQSGNSTEKPSSV